MTKKPCDTQVRFPTKAIRLQFFEEYVDGSETESQALHGSLQGAKDGKCKSFQFNVEGCLFVVTCNGVYNGQYPSSQLW